ncbi:extracellular solute-binding protein [Paenibacillus sp. KQZ6P-2]|uniref:Extracellular solute-binding protein n=1 Tax=Paenibacillus mangrovi TaxID=2931978 RepID=A0A9X1WWV1_9BACL|nr:extracellular solute-binding protein [Paenibacillus mangrovi]MCJ8013489.1 extracellular solute-binding protein [Paenibacillus mangrovi]
MKKFGRSSIIAILMAAIVSGCAQGGTPDNGGKSEPAASPEAVSSGQNIKGKITIATNRTDLVNTKFKEYGEAFKKKYPEVTEVEFEALKDYSNVIKIRASANELPDIIMIPSPQIAATSYPNLFEPLDDLGFNDKIYFKDNYTVDGKLYGISVGGTASGVVYNKKAFEAAGITEVPRTLDAFMDASEKLKSKGIIPLATNFKDSWVLGEWRTLAMALSGDAQYLNNWKNDDAPFNADKPLGQTTAILKTMIDKGYVEEDLMSTNWEASKKDIASGKIAMFLLGNWVVPQIIENGASSQDIGFFPMPYGNSGSLTTVISPGMPWGVSKNSKNIDTAKAFVKFMVEDSGFDDFGGYLPVLKDRESKMEQLKNFMAMGPKVIENPPLDADYSTILNKAQFDIGTYMQEVLTGNQQETIDKYNKKWADAKK